MAARLFKPNIEGELIDGGSIKKTRNQELINPPKTYRRHTLVLTLLQSENCEDREGKGKGRARERGRERQELQKEDFVFKFSVF